MTTLLLILFLGSLLIAWVGYMRTHHLDLSGFPISVPVCRLDGRLPTGATLTVEDLEQFGYVAELHASGEYRLRPLNRYEQRDQGGVSAAPYDFWSSARLRVVDGSWRLEVRTGLGLNLVMCVVALWWMLESSASGLSVFWAIFVAAHTWFGWKSARDTYERLGGQLSRLGA